MNDDTIPVEEEMQDEAQDGKKAWQEELTVAGDEVLGKVQELLREAAVRKITVKDAKGKTILSLPLYAGVAGALVIGPWTALVLVGAWLGNFSILIEYEDVEKEEAVETAVAAASKSRPAPAAGLTGVKGIGPKTAEKLAAAGITRIDQLAKLSADELMKIAGVNQETAVAWIAQAEGLE
jgi:transcription termination factor NusA